ncbi:hypothetical protein CHARACLAT_024595 [Characodon lateralis]|uniref:Uncharacterized protein n=1 Tax=Characodon lateralis TaxID=208331 RepID=A0ABU7EFH6_9TELE|nr:hypothetical protein [Characodon lateralis]
MDFPLLLSAESYCICGNHLRFSKDNREAEEEAKDAISTPDTAVSAAVWRSVFEILLRRWNLPTELQPILSVSPE